jgi:hypothetical protein
MSMRHTSVCFVNNGCRDKMKQNKTFPDRLQEGIIKFNPPIISVAFQNHLHTKFVRLSFNYSIQFLVLEKQKWLHDLGDD